MIINNIIGGKKYPITSPEGYIDDKGYINPTINYMKDLKITNATTPFEGDMFYGNNKYYCISGNRMAYSKDCVMWIESTMNMEIPSGIIYGNGKFVTYDRNNFYVSEDCVNWSVIPSPTRIDQWSQIEMALNIGGIEYCNGMFVAFGSRSDGTITDEGVIVYSSDCVNWIEYQYSTYTNHMTSGNGKFARLDDMGNIYYSEDGIDWTYVDTAPAMGSGGYLTFENGKFLCFDAENKIMASSEDCITWTELNFPDIPEDINIYKTIYMCEAYGYYIINIDGYALLSTDCITWIHDAENPIIDASVINDRFYKHSGVNIIFYDYIDVPIIILPANTYLDNVYYMKIEEWINDLLGGIANGSY